MTKVGEMEQDMQWIPRDHTSEMQAALQGRQGTEVWVSFARWEDGRQVPKRFKVQLVRGDKSYMDLRLCLARLQTTTSNLRKENKAIEDKIPVGFPNYRPPTFLSCFQHERKRVLKPGPGPGSFDAFKWLNEAKYQEELEKKDAELARRRREEREQGKQLEAKYQEELEKKDAELARRRREEREQGKQLEAALERRLEELMERLEGMPVPASRLVLAEPTPRRSLPEMERQHALRMAELEERKGELEAELQVLRIASPATTTAASASACHRDHGSHQRASSEPLRLENQWCEFSFPFSLAVGQCEQTTFSTWQLSPGLQKD
eukprot:CAMPEP_0196758206 /NCGR_PEP_ID=MMETSP1091-20130531/104067_1 /TAXON_ID=302021 /ORGANISM="Rhodomonas sp., Strain CCMP768" /LENGTH=320 /DNA_ID=CAMNT_0042107017 /DNA_START=48 /DNA_END=1011 /DNA_ORIENTATION=+